MLTVCQFMPRRNWVEKEWSSGTQFFGCSYFPKYWDNLARYTQNFEMRFRKMSFPFTSHPVFPEFVVEWKAPGVNRLATKGEKISLTTDKTIEENITD